MKNLKFYYMYIFFLLLYIYFIVFTFFYIIFFDNLHFIVYIYVITCNLHSYILCIYTQFYVSKSKIDWDVDYFERFVEHNPHTDPGMGVYQNCDGKYDIPVVGVDIVSVDSNKLHPLQKRYKMDSGYDEDFRICPTLKSIRTGKIPLPFRVNHSQFFPTHKLIWVPDALDYPHSHPVLKGIKYISAHTEISFDYNYGNVVYKL